MSQQLNPLQIKSLNEVGRYAVGMHWSDGHESIFPLDNLRRQCPCLKCNGSAAAEHNGGKAAGKTGAAPTAAQQFSKEDFKNDPLIKKALEIFKGTIVEVRA